MALDQKKKTSPSFWAKINAIQTSAAAAHKDTEAIVGGGGRKKVVSIESILNVYLPLCKEHGISIVPVKQEIVEAKTFLNKQNNNEWSIIAISHFRAVDTSSSDYHDFTVISQGMDTGDKATGKLATYALKYAYKQLFSSRSTEDDPDVAPEPEKQQERKSQPAQQKEAPDETEAKREEFNRCKAKIKEQYDLKDAHETNRIPSWKNEMRPFVIGLLKDVRFEDVKKHVTDFALFWWHCVDLSGNLDIKKAEANYKKSKSKLSNANIDFIETIIAKRKAEVESQE